MVKYQEEDGKLHAILVLALSNPSLKDKSGNASYERPYMFYL